MKKTLIALVAVLAAAVVALPASAITDGSPDGDAHPYVGLMVAQDADGNPLWRCSGTLISPTLFLTAGHCTETPAAHVVLGEAFLQAKDLDSARKEAERALEMSPGMTSATELLARTRSAPAR